MKIQDRIINYLKDLEKEKNIQVLLAVETGSRAWGFPSPDSDYDVRLIYRNRPDWYLSLREKKDSIDRMYDDRDIDIAAWDLRKCLRLLTKSNAPLLERVQSPIIYMQDPDFKQEMNDLSNQFYSRIATMHHYLSMSKKIMHEIKHLESYKLKKMFYLVRTAFACQWIMDREEKPPIDFHVMRAGLNIDQNINERINELVQLKSTSNESYYHSNEKPLFDYVDAILNKAKAVAQQLPAAKGDVQLLDAFFIRTIRKEWT